MRVFGKDGDGKNDAHSVYGRLFLDQQPPTIKVKTKGAGCNKQTINRIGTFLVEPFSAFFLLHTYVEEDDEEQEFLWTNNIRGVHKRDF
jgi:hypothetical protein